MSGKETILSYLDGEDEKLCYLAKEIWDHPEIGLEEKFAADLLSKELVEAGFTIERGVGQMETAFVASWGTGRPIIGILGEYDALPGLSQDLSPDKKPLVNGGPGHGCGHNLFGTAGVGAVIAVKEAMQKEEIQGTIRFYGCPAEETLVGKVFMARDGVFDDLDAALAWHPASTNQVWSGSSLAMNSFKVNFHGVASHAGVAPELGRSALDAAMLMDVGVNYMREHVTTEARIHSVVTSGGQAPNVVPAFAQIWYFVRAPKREQVDEIYAWMLDIAKGAAMMTQTTHDIDFITGCYDFLPNQTIGWLMLEKMQALGGIEFTEQEKAFAKELQKSFPANATKNDIAHTLSSAAPEFDKSSLGEELCEVVIPHTEEVHIGSGSTEVGDVSYITPTAQIVTSCHPLGTPPHSWQLVAASGSSIGFKGMMFAAKSMALTAYDLMTKPNVLAKAQKEFKETLGETRYVTPLPEGAVPH